LIWKVHFEQAQIEERARNIELARRSYCRSVVASMSNLRWKVWLAGSRTELNQNNIATARTLLNRALEEVPVKTRAVVLIECARLEEYTGDLKKARQFLKRAQREAKHEWKVFLESILLEMRAGEHERAIEEAKKALKIHRGTGRLWAVLIQLKGCLEGPDAQLKVFREALDEVPKSGEVWCEGARIRLNPLTSKFNLEKARKYLDFAIKFTPQYGDSFIEYLRLELLTRGPYDDSQLVLESGESRPFDNNHYDIEQLCVNADPNYGPLWFHCKENVLDSTRQVLRRAKKLLMAELLEYRDLYQQAIMSGNSTVSNSSTVVVNNKLYSCRDFITGLHELNMTYSNASVTDMALRKKYIYGSEICV
jgi:tetratricopeptide (TPR) repeat protein